MDPLSSYELSISAGREERDTEQYQQCHEVMRIQ